MNVQQQENESDCDVFAIAFAKCLLEGKDPSEYDFVNLPQESSYFTCVCVLCLCLVFCVSNLCF